MNRVKDLIHDQLLERKGRQRFFSYFFVKYDLMKVLNFMMSSSSRLLEIWRRRIFNDLEYGGEFELLTVDKILEHRAFTGYDYPENWFPIAYGYDGCYLIVTNKMAGCWYYFIV